MRRYTSRLPGGLTSVLLATGCAGALAYVVVTVAAAALGSDYQLFAIFWSALYLVVGTLAGVQQEVTRATRPRMADESSRRAEPWIVAFSLAAAVVIVIVATSPAWSARLFGDDAPPLVAALAFGAFSYVFVATCSGLLYGLRMWRPLSFIIVSDVAIRLVLIVVAILLNFDVPAMVWAIVVPFPALVAFTLLAVGSRLSREAELDVGYRAIYGNIARTLVAAGATSLLVNGFPLLLGASSPGESDQVLAAVIFALVLTRGPLVVTTLSLQSYLVLLFRDRVGTWHRPLLGASAAAAGVGILLALLAWWFGVDVIVAIAGEEFRLDSVYLALLVLSSVPTACIAVSGAAVLARAAHSSFTAGWVLAALTGVALLFIPGDIYLRSLTALFGGPTIGLIAHLVALALSTRAGTGGAR